MKPWGHIDWLLKWYPNRDWITISGIGFEERCKSLVEHSTTTGISIRKLIALIIEDPDDRYRDEIDQSTKRHENFVKNSFPDAVIMREKLMTSPEYLISLVDAECYENRPSFLLDISTLPKRIGLFILRQLLRNDNVEDIVVCYCKSSGYREGNLAQNELPRKILPGFGLTSSVTRESAFVVSVGYSTIDLSQVLEEAPSNITFIVPFPPASPSSRRTWQFLETLSQNLPSITMPIVQFNSVDMFSVYDWLVGHLDPEKNTRMIPLGPKPHSIAMALAQLANSNHSEVIYPQPQLYHPKYSLGVQHERDGRASIVAYGLRRSGQNVLQ